MSINPSFNISEMLAQQSSERTALVKAALEQSVKAPSSAYEMNIKKMVDELVGPQINIHQMMAERFADHNSLVTPSAKEAVQGAVRANEVAMKQMRDRMTEFSGSASMAMRLESLSGMGSLAETMTKAWLKNQGPSVWDMARSVSESPDVLAAVTHIARENSVEDLEESGLVEDGDTSRLDEEALQELAALVDRMEHGMDVDWDRVTPIVLHLWSILIALVAIVYPPAAPAMQVGGSAVGLLHEVLKDK